jgi:hypothetical protein
MSLKHLLKLTRAPEHHLEPLLDGEGRQIVQFEFQFPFLVLLIPSDL